VKVCLCFSFACSVFPCLLWKKSFRKDGVCQLKGWWMFVGRMLLCEKAGGQDSTTLLLFHCDALLGIYQITLVYPRLRTKHGRIIVSCRISVTSTLVHHWPLPVIEPLLCRGSPPLWSSGQSSWLQIQKSRIRFPALPDFLRYSGSGTGSTHPREYNWGATWKKE
jgi:hypothetical protein